MLRFINVFTYCLHCYCKNYFFCTIIAIFFFYAGFRRFFFKWMDCYYCLVVSITLCMLLWAIVKKWEFYLTSGCFVRVLCPFPPLSSCNTICNPVAYATCTDSPTVTPTSSSPTLPTPQEPISAGAIAGLAVAGVVVAVVAVTLSDA